jgi:exonuclease III
VEAELVALLGGEGGGEGGGDEGAAAWQVGWACSTARKGYAGVATAWRRARFPAATCAPLLVDAAHVAGQEGRTLAWRLPLRRGAARGGVAAGRLSLINVYTPNAGAKLERLAYRVHPTEGWDARFRSALRSEAAAVAAYHPSEAAAEGAAGADGGEAAPGGHVCVGGDLNVAVEDIDFYNPAARHVAKQAGLTPEERASARLLTSAAPATDGLGMLDCFRLRHPHAAGQYTYWSQRARNRPLNRGLRLDYFLLSSGAPPSAVLEAQHLQQLLGSDHAPLLLELDLAQLE